MWENGEEIAGADNYGMLDVMREEEVDIMNTALPLIEQSLVTKGLGKVCAESNSLTVI
jgi:hypothetical protein